MVLALLMIACDRPDMINAEVTFVTPVPGDEVCGADLEAEADVATEIDDAADAVLLAFFDDLEEEQEWDPEGRLQVVSTVALKAGENNGTLTGSVDWDTIAEEGTGRVLLVADVGSFPDLHEGDRLDVEEYQETVGIADVWARATVSVRTCPL
jgi:hypothetical protein